MAQRRMFSKHILDSDAFMDMPMTSQLLYMHLAIRADDDGFVDSPKKIIRMIGSQDDDYKILIAKRFILPFESGVCVIKHWLIHNYIQKDRYTETIYIEEKNALQIKDNGVYTECIHDVSSLDSQVRLGKVSKEIENKNPLSYLQGLNKEQAQEFVDKFNCDLQQVKTKANALLDYCKSKGKVYKDYKALLSNALRKDFGERPKKESIPKFDIIDGKAVRVS